MNHPANQSPPADVCLLLRAHTEARWLSREVVPLIRELEQDRDSHPGLASYLHTLCIEARHHAAATDAVRIELDAQPPNGDHELHHKARRYHAAVRRLRATVDRRVEALVGAVVQPPAAVPNPRKHPAAHNGAHPHGAAARAEARLSGATAGDAAA
jgi:hypothetical protein